MADAAVSAVAFLAKVAIRIMQLMEVQKDNIKYSGDLLKRIKSIHHILGLLAALPKDDLADLSGIIDDLREVLEETEAFVSKSVEDATGKKTTFFGKFKKARSLQNAEVIRDKLAKMDEKMDRHLQLLTAAQGAKQLQQSARIEDQVKQLEALSSQMFAFTLMANGMKQGQLPASAGMAMRAQNKRASRRARAPSPVYESAEEEKGDDASYDEDRFAVDIESPLNVTAGRSAGQNGDRKLDTFVNPIAAQVDELLANNQLPSAADPNSNRLARYLEMAAHQFVCGSFVGGLAMIPDDPGKRVAIIFTVPLIPILTMLYFAYLSGQLRSMLNAAGRKPFLKMCWTIYRLYATPGIVGACILAFQGRLLISDGIVMYSSYLSSCLAGIAVFLLGYWLSEDT